MADTARTLQALQNLFADNTTGNISAQDLRDFLVSAHPEALGYFEQTQAEVSAAVAISDYGHRPGDIRRYGAVGDDSTDNATAIQGAINVASAGLGYVIVPNGTFQYASDLQMKSEVAIIGYGHKSHLKGNGAALKVDGVTQGAHVTDWKLSNFQLSRIGTAGPALHTTGDGTAGSNKGAIRFAIDRLYITASTNDGWLAQNTYLGSVSQSFFRGCTGAGFKAQLDPTSSTVSVNAVQFLGGEIQNNGYGVDIDSVAGLDFFGTTIEGNTNGSIIRDNCRQVKFDGVYWELNGSAAGDRDVVVGSAGSSSYAISFKNNIFWNGSGSVKASAIELVKVESIDIDTCAFVSYATAGINNTVVTNVVKGRYRNSTAKVSGSVCVTDSLHFRKELDEAILTGSGTWDVPSLLAGDIAQTTITVTGAATTDFVHIARAGGFSDVNFFGQVTAADTVTITAHNTGTSTRDPGSTTYRAIVIPSGYYF